MPVKQPAWQLSLDGQPLNIPQGRLISLTLRDNPGGEADQLTLVLSDHDGQLQLPAKGAVLSLALGFENARIDKGQYTVDELSHSGPPDQLTIRARSAELRTSLAQTRSHSWHQLSLGDILTSIAKRHNLLPAIQAKLAAIQIPHIDQSNESDLHFITRLGKQYDALASTKSGRLVFTAQAQGKTVTGAALPTIHIARSDGDSHQYRVSDRQDKLTGVKANWVNVYAAQMITELAGKEGNTKTLRASYADAAQAKQAAQSAWQQQKRSGSAMQISLAIGRPAIIPESPVTLSGFKPQIDQTQWVAGVVTHTLDDKGLVTSITLQPRGLQR